MSSTSNSDTSSSSYVSLGTTVTGTYVKACLSGTLNSYSVAGNGSTTPSSGSTSFSAEELTLTLTPVSSKNIYSIKIFCGSTLVRTMNCYGGTYFNVTYDYINLGTYASSLTIPLNETTKHYGGNPYGYTAVSYTGGFSTSSYGNQKIYVKINYDSSESSYDWLEVGYVYFNALVFDSITINTSSVTTTFYKNATFSRSGLIVYALYNYCSDCGGNYAKTATVSSSAGVSGYDMTTAGTQTVTVSYNSGTATYSIEVIGVDYITENSTDYYRYGLDTAPDTPTSIKIVYTDGSSRTITSDIDTYFAWSSYSFSTVGTKTCTFTMYDSYTSETVSETATKYVRDVTAINITTQPTTTAYQTNETIDLTGAVITATFNDAGTGVIDNDLVTITSPNMTTTGTKTVTLTYRGQSATFSITVDGISSIRLYGYPTKLVNGDTTSSLTSGLQVFYTCTDQEETELSLSSSKVSIDTSEVNRGVNGTYSVYVTVTHEGNSITESYDIEVYSLDSLVLSGYTDTFIYVDSEPTFSVGSLVVVGHFSDGTSTTLSSSDYVVSEPDNMGVGTHEVTISATVGATVSATYEIYVISDYPTEIVSVDLSDWTGVFTAGNTFSSSGIIVYAKMAGGNNKKQVSFSTSLDGLVFGSDITATSTNFTLSITSYDEDEGTTTTLTVAYDSELIEDSATLTAIYDKLTAITVDTTDATVDYKAGETISKDGLVVTATFSSTGDVPLSEDDYTLSKTSAFTASEVGSNTITITYEGCTTTYSVTVWVLNSITVSSSQTQYDRYEDLDFTLLTIRKIYSDGTNTTDEALSYEDCSFDGRYEKMIPDNDDGLTTTITASYTEATVTKTNTLTLTIKALSSVELYGVDTIDVNYGSTISLVGNTLTITFNTGDIYSPTINSGNVIVMDGESYELAISPSDATSYIKNEVDDVTIGLTFGYETKYATFTIHCIYLNSITVDASTYTDTTMYAGESIDFSNISVTANYYSTNEEDEDYPSSVSVSDGLTYSVSDGYTLTSGTNTIQVTYTTGSGNTLQTKTATITITAEDVDLESISCDTSSLETALDSYVEGQSLSLSGLVVSAVFNQTSSNRDLSLTECVFYIDGEERYYTTALTTDDDGKVLKVAYTYGSTTKECTVGTLSVAAKVISSIEIKSSSTHDTAFEIGDLFTTTGLILLATYNDGYEETITSGFSTSYDAYKTTVLTSGLVGTQTVTVSLTVDSTTVTCTYTITITIPELASLSFDTSLISLSVTNGNAYSITGLIVYGVFTNGYSELLTIDADSSYSAGEWYSDVETALSIVDGVVTVSSSDLGTKTVTVTGVNPYDSTDSVTGTLSVTIEPNLELVKIQLEFFDADGETDNGEYAKDYVVGDTFDAKGVRVLALFADTDWMEVTGWTASNPTLGSTLRSGGRYTVTVTYTSQGVAATAEYPIVVSLEGSSGLIDESTYKVAFNVDSVTHDEVEIEFSSDTQLPLFLASLISVDADEESDYYGLNIYTGSDADSDCIGYIKLGSTSDNDGSIIENAKLVLFDDPVNPIDGEGNIIVKFPHYVSGYADRINNCHFGVMYNKRLFLAGNPDYPNIDWHSTEVNSAQVENYDIEEDKDLTYFSDLDYCKYGSENSAIKGYDIYRDGTLLVFKEKAQHEATVYTRTTQLVNASSYDGTVVSEDELAEEAYPCFEVNPNGGTGALSPYTIINFVGETLVLTREGLKAITSKEATYNNAKYSYDVSSHINNHLTKNNDLTDAYISQFKEKILLKTDEGLYIGEYKIRDENSEYEWYFCDNIDAYYFFEIDNELYFSDEDGNINRFIDSDDIERKDKPRVYVGTGGTTISIDASNDTLIVSSDYGDEIVEGREFHLLNVISSITGEVTDESQIYATMGRYGTFVNTTYRDNALEESLSSFDQTAYVGLIDPDNNELILMPYDSDGEVDIDQMLLDRLYYNEDRTVYIDQIEGDVVNVAIDTPYTLSRVESDTPFDYRYQLLDSDGDVVDLSGIETFRLSFRVSELAKAYISDVEDYGDEGAKTFKVSVPMQYDSDSEENVDIELDLIYYNDRNGTYKGVITDHENVNAYYITKPFNLGHDLYMKTIYLWSIINDTQIASYMDLGYIASRKYADYKYSVKETGGARQLDFEGLNFDKLHFTNDLLPHIYTRARIVPRVGFIRFIFANDEGTRMVLSKLEIIYTYSSLMKGVK